MERACHILVMTRHLSETERRQQILKAARSVFIEKGCMAARMQDVAERAALSKGAVYFYFSSKKELFDALVEEEYRTTMGILEAAAQDPRPAAVRFVELGARYLEYFAALEAPPRFFLLMIEMATRDAGVRARVTDIHAQFVSRVEALIAAGIEEGSFREVDPTTASLMLKALIDGLAGQSAVGIKLDVARLSTDGIRLVMQGLARVPDGTAAGEEFQPALKDAARQTRS